MARRPPLTHFLCLPLATDAARGQLEGAAQQFRARLPAASANQLDPATLGRAIRPVGTLHLTLGVMALESGERVDKACALLRELDLAGMLRASASATARAADAPLTITLLSLDSMRRGPRTSSLYAAPLDTTGRLVPFCEALRARFAAAGFVLPEQREFKLHATVLNTLYADGGSHGDRRSKKPLQFDPAGLVREFENFVWAEEVRVERVAVCKMGAKKILDADGRVVDEAYEEVAAVGMPGG